jgi:hypothetical protein
MKPVTIRAILLFVAIITFGALAFFLAYGSLAQATAQQSGDIWTSSDEAPPGTTLDMFSPPDLPVTNNQEGPGITNTLVSWRVTGSALRPRENTVSNTVNSSGGCIYVTAGSAFTVWNTTPDLPQGAVVDTLRMYYHDTNASNSTAWFTVYDLYGAIVQEWSVSSTGNFGNSFNDSVAIDHTVDYSLYSYLINWRPIVTGSTMQLCGFRVFYTPPPFGIVFLPHISTAP